MTRAERLTPIHARFGPGRLAELPAACAELGVRRPLIVTDRTLVAHRAVGETLDRLSGAGLSVGLYWDVRPNPREEDVRRGVEALLRRDHDGVIAVGGGSVLDAGKVIGLLAAAERPLWALELPVASAGRRLPVIAVPTVAGTGAEASPHAVIRLTGERRKRTLTHPGLVPDRVIVDPRLTATAPAAVAAAVGLDAFALCAEAWCAPGLDVAADAAAIAGARGVLTHLRRAVVDPEDLDAVAGVAGASLLAGAARAKGPGPADALANAVSAGVDAHHGAAMAVLWPLVARLDEAGARRLDELAGHLGHSSGEALAEAFIGLRESLGLPASLVALGLGPTDVEAIAAAAAVIDAHGLFHTALGSHPTG